MWDTPRRAADDILSIVGVLGRGVHAVSMTNKMAYLKINMLRGSSADQVDIL